MCTSLAHSQAPEQERPRQPTHTSTSTTGQSPLCRFIRWRSVVRSHQLPPYTPTHPDELFVQPHTNQHTTCGSVLLVLVCYDHNAAPKRRHPTGVPPVAGVAVCRLRDGGMPRLSAHHDPAHTHMHTHTRTCQSNHVTRAQHPHQASPSRSVPPLPVEAHTTSSGAAFDVLAQCRGPEPVE